jgi:hypothetical protein
MAALFLALAAAVPSTTRADAPADVALPSEPASALELGSIPNGYADATRGAIRWVHPTDEARRVPQLEAVVEESWPRLAHELGQDLDPRLTIVLARDLDALRRLAPRGHPPPRYAIGVAYPSAGFVFLVLDGPGISAAPDLPAVLVHELSHVALYRATAGRPVPRWFAEGLAIHQAGEQTLARMQVLYGALEDGGLVRLGALDESFAAHAFEVDVAYAQSADLVGFLARDDRSPQKLRKLVAELRRGEPFERALLASFHFSLPSLEREWRADLQRRFGSLPLVLGGSALWVLASVLLLFAFRKRQGQKRRRLSQMAHEEEAARRLEALVEARLAAVTAEESRSEPTDSEDDLVFDELPSPRTDETVPKIVHDGRSHTVH